MQLIDRNLRACIADPERLAHVMIFVADGTGSFRFLSSNRLAQLSGLRRSFDPTSWLLSGSGPCPR